MNPKVSKTIKESLRKTGCTSDDWSKSPTSIHADLCGLRHKMQLHGRRRGTRDTIQSLEINGLKTEVSRLTKFVDMLLILVDPEDVQAALRIEKKMPSDEELQDLGSDFTPPAELLDEDWGID